MAVVDQTERRGPGVRTDRAVADPGGQDLIEQNIGLTLHYRVYFTTDIFRLENELLRNIVRGEDQEPPPKLLFLVDSALERCHPYLPETITDYCRYHAPAFSLVAAPLVMPGGEQVKNDFRHVDAVHGAIHQFGLCRHCYLAVVGGGALIDMAGFAAATAHRGIRLIRIPTTTLAQADGALGIKNGINAHGRKNFLGTFAAPWAVINDAAFLPSLSDRDWISGVAEALKVALIKDTAFFEFIEAHAAALKGRDLDIMDRVIRRSAALHLAHIATSGDPLEAGNSRPLDFGHWTAHWLEQTGGYALRHGEAVAIGLAVDAVYSSLTGLLADADRRRILAVLRALGFSFHAPDLFRAEAVREGLKEFREHLGGMLTIMLLAGIGRGVEVHTMIPELIERAIAQVLGKGEGGEL